MHTIALIGCGRISFKHIEDFVDNADELKLADVCYDEGNDKIILGLRKSRRC
jgi:hypothetical protein